MIPSLRALLRVFACAALGALSLPACGSSEAAPAPFVLELLADDGAMSGNPILLEAVDEIQLVFEPDSMSGDSFLAVERMSFEDGSVDSWVDPTGAWVLLLRRPYIDAHAYPVGTSFGIEIPLYTDDLDDPSVADPIARVAFHRYNTTTTRAVEIARAERYLPWPLPEGGREQMLVICPSAFRSQCLDMDP
ncbi:MAG: hypothetical protein OEY14_13970 [Myxococcales bacterium]|nr:hypothetical protein [Myxococcales bacterium]